MSAGKWSEAATILKRRPICKSLTVDRITSYLWHHGRQKCAEYDIVCTPEACGTRSLAQYEAYELATAMGLDQVAAYPERNSLFNVSQHAAEERTVSTASQKKHERPPTTHRTKSRSRGG